MIDIPCITLILSKIGKSFLQLSPILFVIRLDSLCDSLGARTQDPILKRDVLYQLSSRVYLVAVKRVQRYY